ncbi:hypothetical protein [Neorhizobium petrolearium]|uniref:hypothetical protein n=1 Tax=Neorhizobium petrolearium TaxID=515361 RepID=UPI003F18CDAA
MRTTISAKGRKQLDRFMHRLMEPLSEEILADIEYNRMAREARYVEWKKAKATLGLWSARYQLHFAIYIFDRDVAGQEMTEQDEDMFSHRLSDLMQKMRAATAAQLRAPAPDQAAIEWKKRRLADEASWRGCITHEQLNEFIIKDEAFLEAHPIRKTKEARR